MKKYLLTTLMCISTIILLGQDTLTIGQVFNYNIGDKMHYETDYDFCSPGYAKDGVRKTILDKWMSSDNDTIFYIIHYNNYEERSYPDVPYQVTYSVKDDTTFVTNLDKKITYLADWDNIDINDSIIVDFQYDYGNNAEYGDVLTNGYSYAIGYDELDYAADLWAEGLGMIKIYSSERVEDDCYFTQEKKIVYYKKGDTEWGNKLMLGIEDTEKATALSCVPNPATTHIKINNTHAGQLSIYALNGQLLKQIALQPQQPIDISDLSTGAYILQWQDVIGQQMQRAKLLKR